MERAEQYTQIRVIKKYRDKLRELAKKNKRTMRGQFEFLIDEAEGVNKSAKKTS